jgi:hypothetical protein
MDLTGLEISLVAFGSVATLVAAGLFTKKGTQWALALIKGA